MKISIDTSKLDLLITKGKDIFLTGEAEEAIVEMEYLRKEVDEAYERMKKEIAEKALEVDENFKAIKGDRVKIGYRTYGQKYTIDESNLKFLPKEFYKVKKTIKYSPDTKVIDGFVKEHRKLPMGITEPERKKSLSIKVKDE